MISQLVLLCDESTLTLNIVRPCSLKYVLSRCIHLSDLVFFPGDQRGKWAARTIRFGPSGLESLSDGTPLGGVIVWNSKRLFPREQRGVSIADIAKVEHSGKVSSGHDQ